MKEDGEKRGLKNTWYILEIVFMKSNTIYKKYTNKNSQLKND